LEWIFADIYHYAVGGQVCLKIDKRKDAKTAKKALKAVDYKGDTIFSALLSKNIVDPKNWTTKFTP